MGRSRRDIPPQRPGGSMQKVQELTGQVVVGALPEAGIPRLLERDLARKYKKRAFTPTLSTVYDVPVQEENEEEDEEDGGTGLNEMYSKHTLKLPMHPHSPAYVDNSQAEMDMNQLGEELEYPDDAPPIPGVPSEFRRPCPRQPSPPQLYTFLDDLSSLSEDVDEFAETLPATIMKRDEDTKAIDYDDKPVTTSTTSKVASSLRRHLSMSNMREKFGSTDALSHTFHLPGRHVKELVEQKPAAGTHGEGSLARRLLRRNKKPKRPPIPEGWLFGPPPE